MDSIKFNAGFLWPDLFLVANFHLFPREVSSLWLNGFSMEDGDACLEQSCNVELRAQAYACKLGFPVSMDQIHLQSFGWLGPIVEITCPWFHGARLKPNLHSLFTFVIYLTW